MIVRKIEEPDGTLTQLQFSVSGEQTVAEFKQAIKDWIRVNYPEMTYNEVFDRMIEFGPTKGALDMR